MSDGGASDDGTPAPAVARSDAELRALVEAHGLGGRRVVPMQATGIANDIWALGDDLVLRVGRAWEEAWSDARTETVAVPVAIAAGIRTPRLVAFDLSRRIVDAPVTIYERVHGDTLGLVMDRRESWASAMRGVGRELARLHAGVTHVDDPQGWLDDPGREDSRALLETGAAMLEPELAALLDRWLDRLEPSIRESVTPRFLHGDVHAFNLMVDRDGEHLALLDWGDAGWGDPAVELSTVAIDWIEPLVDGYRREGPALVDDAFVGRVLWNQIGHSLRKVANPRPGRSASAGVERLQRLHAWTRRATDTCRAWLR